MNIWRPYPSYRDSLDVLTDEHVTDVLYIGMDTLRGMFGAGPSGKHIEQWRATPSALVHYVLQADMELGVRGFDPDPGPAQLVVWLMRQGYRTELDKDPHWLGDRKFHTAHMSNLIRVNPEHYARRLPPTVPLDLPMVWPKGN